MIKVHSNFTFNCEFAETWHIVIKYMLNRGILSLTSKKMSNGTTKIVALFCLLFGLQSIDLRAQAYINEIVASNGQSFPDEDGDFPDWIELFNASEETIDLLGYGISDDPQDPFKYTLPNLELAAGGYALLFASDKDRPGPNARPHLNFKLSSAGETVVLTQPGSVTLHSITYPPLNRDESYGRSSLGGADLFIFKDPTPLQANPESGYNGRLPDPGLSLSGGFYDGPIALSLTDPGMGDKVYFTDDGSVPDTGSEVFGSGPRDVGSTLALRFRAMENGKLSSNVVTHTYFIGSDHALPVVSVTTPPDNLWSDDHGIYVRGTGKIPNFKQDWEIPVHIEYYELDKELGFSSGAGAKISGHGSTGFPQKSLAIYFRGEYGNPELEYRLFESKGIDKFQAFVLRNSGNDFNVVHFRDGLMAVLVQDTEIDVRAFKPAVVYLNGEYWGIHNIREKINEHFVSSNSDAKATDVDLLKYAGRAIHGSGQHYRELLDMLASADLQNEPEYKAVENLMDMDNYIDYMAAEIYYENTDWPGNNIKFWRDAANNGKWRWIMYDTDYGFGWRHGVPGAHSTLNFALEPNGRRNNPPWSTFVFRRLVTSEVFVNKFVNRMADLMNTVFDPGFVSYTVDSIAAIIEPEMGKHLTKWEEYAGTRRSYQEGRPWNYGGVSDWKGRVNRLKTFGSQRPMYMEGYIMDRFGVAAPKETTVDVSDRSMGSVKVNRVVPTAYPWTGRYFGGVPVQVTAVPKPGHEFTGWSGSSGPTEHAKQPIAAEASGSLLSTEHTVTVEAGASLTANFEEPGDSPSIVINEIMYNALDGQDPGDWVELHNPTASEIDISGWAIKDEDDTHSYTFPASTVMSSGSFLVVAADLEAFNSQRPRRLGGTAQPHSI